MAKLNLILITLFVVTVTFFAGTFAGRPVPGAMRKLAMNNNGRLFVKRDDAPAAAGDQPASNHIPPLLIPYANSLRGMDDYYDESQEVRCPPGTTLYFKSGQCVPDRCGFGMIRDHTTGDCVNDEDMPNNIPIMDAFIDPIRRPTRGRMASGPRGKPSRAIMRVLG